MTIREFLFRAALVLALYGAHAAGGIQIDAAADGTACDSDGECADLCPDTERDGTFNCRAWILD